MLKTALLTICGLLILTSLGYSRDPTGKYAQSPNKKWFEGLRNKTGGSCCGEADCHREIDGKFKWRNSQTGEGYEIQILPSQTWIPVVDAAIPLVVDNPTNGALACWSGDALTIYCFVPPINPELPPE